MSDTLLKIEHIYKSYGANEVLKDVSLTVNKGEVIVIIGPSGCGKSTLLRCVNALEDIQGGRILLDDLPVLQKGKDISQMRQKIGMVFQSYDLFPHKTVLDNITLAPIKVQKRAKAEVQEEALALLDRVGLKDRKDDFPRQLSGGQKQRVAIVRALCMHPEILLLDEITAALDPEMVREVLDVVLGLARSGITMLIVTHEMSFAKAIADRVIFLENGQIVEESDSPEAFFGEPATERARQFLNTFDYGKHEAKDGAGS